ncbi:hypothetical protein BLNAU_4104 [Blattamonas nauphoetae]|uniref:Uncharacterized protein n=1 Tax=Blattamonas nauphoetae TaxID=2049346 RepID=A0ABQ9YB68_9EUKA|nr:hypothetical protein BLNAU_4104 [Blattamonas nauphoetae]
MWKRKRLRKASRVHQPCFGLEWIEVRGSTKQPRPIYDKSTHNSPNPVLMFKECMQCSFPPSKPFALPASIIRDFSSNIHPTHRSSVDMARLFGTSREMTTRHGCF